MPQLIFCDSYDHYTTITDKWDRAGIDNQINTNKPRTGTQALQIVSASFGPTKLFAQTKHLTVGSGVFFSSAGEIFWMLWALSTIQNVSFRAQSDGSILCYSGNGSSPGVINLGTTATGVFQFNVYNYIEAAVFCAAAPNGTVVLKVNGQIVLNLTGVQTYGAFDGAQPFMTGCEMMGPGGIPIAAYHDDTVMSDWTNTLSQPFYGALRLYMVLPTADRSPLQWLPTPGPGHFNMVNEVPPDGDTSYVASGTVGNIDQYQYTSATLPAGAQIQFVQHSLDSKLDAAGSGSIESVAGGNPSTILIPLTTNYHIYTTPWNNNPVTTNPWLLSDFPFNFGPEVGA